MENSNEVVDAGVPIPAGVPTQVTDTEEATNTDNATDLEDITPIRTRARRELNAKVRYLIERTKREIGEEALLLTEGVYSGSDKTRFTIYMAYRDILKGYILEAFKDRDSLLLQRIIESWEATFAGTIRLRKELAKLVIEHRENNINGYREKLRRLKDDFVHQKYLMNEVRRKVKEEKGEETKYYVSLVLKINRVGGLFIGGLNKYLTWRSITSFKDKTDVIKGEIHGYLEGKLGSNLDVDAQINGLLAKIVNARVESWVWYDLVTENKYETRGYAGTKDLTTKMRETVREIKIQRGRIDLLWTDLQTMRMAEWFDPYVAP